MNFSGTLRLGRDDGGDWSDWCDLLPVGDEVGDGWGVLGPVDLDNVAGLGWGGDSASDLELRFHHDGFGPSPPVDPDDTLIRIGWVKLEETVQ